MTEYLLVRQKRFARSRKAVAAGVVAAMGLAGCGESQSQRHTADKPRESRAPGAARPHERKQRAPRAEARPARTVVKRRGIRAFVTRVVDGDTIEAMFRGRIADVRLIGIDTPESVDPRAPVECFAKAAAAFTERRLGGRRVRLEFDVERIDRYGRTLAYVWRRGRLFNRTLVARGYAHVYTFPPNVKYVELLVAAQRKARASNRGLWGGCRASRGSGMRAASRSGRARCDPNYRGGCIPRYPPDLDCSDVSASNFGSFGSDPHNFDYDRDGRACEG